MNPRRMLLIMILIVVVAAAILIVKLNDYKEEEDLLASITEPLPEEVLLPVILGSTGPIDEVKVLTKKVEPVVDPEELDLLARLIQEEAGSDWCTDELQRAVGSVVLNRMDDKRYPDTMHGVIDQKGQYSTAKRLDKTTPTERVRKNAEYLLANGSTLPEDVIFQANFKQGKVYKELQGVYFGK